MKEKRVYEYIICCVVYKFIDGFYASEKIRQASRPDKMVLDIYFHVLQLQQPHCIYLFYIPNTVYVIRFLFDKRRGLFAAVDKNLY